MGDPVEVTSQIAPETPGRPSIRNPFESPNDYHHLREALVPSPSVFKYKPCKTTPPKFHWSIEDMASHFPVHIDQEEILRQSFCLSQTRHDSDIEEKRQNAIEQFFTKGTIVPSPWPRPETRKGLELFKTSSVAEMIAEEPERISVACQTTLSLPLTFNLEKVLGDYYRYEEACEAVQESLSSSSLRRKLFLDGLGSSSDSSGPPSPERNQASLGRPTLNREEGATGGVEATATLFSSPLSCSVRAQTPSTGQFSSSPIQKGYFRDASFGSITSPLFLNGSCAAHFASPTVSPIVADIACTPTGTDVPSCNESPYVEGCSPIRSCSPHQLSYSEPQHVTRSMPRVRVLSRISPAFISPILNPRLQDNQEAKELLTCSSSLSTIPAMELDPSSPPTCPPGDGQRVDPDSAEVVKMEEEEEKEKGDEATGVKGTLEYEEEEGGEPLGQLTSSRMGSVSAAETSHMFVSLLAEGSSIRYDSSMQVDSGYSTTSAGTASIIDGLGSDRESFRLNLAEDAFQTTRYTKVKVFHPHH